ncbi:MAG: hypothetical protein IPK85_10420 [Gemmatimonadetes bacterium]|nr:hypothetical protein [Gemmatimonadota bacterium]
MRILKHLPKLATLGALLVLTACSSDMASAPAQSDDVAMPALPNVAAQQAIVAEQVEAPTVGPHGTMASVAYPSNAVTYQFTYNPTTDATYVMGLQMVAFPRYTICDPAVSGYGPNTWLNSCPKLTSPITITATVWTDAQGRPQIDFANSIRFYKNFNNQLPAIYLRDSNAAMSSWGRVDYCSGSGCVNEAASDAVLATQRDPITGYLFRIIRHFSGYNVWA